MGRSGSSCCSSLLTLYAAAILLVDAMLVQFHDEWTPWPFSPVGGIVAGLTGLLVIIITVFVRYLLPPGIRCSLAAEGRALTCWSSSRA